MENVQEKILDIRVRYDDAIRKISDYRSQLDVVRKLEKTLKEDLDAGRISRDKYNLKLSEAKVAEKEYTETLRTVSKEVSNNRKVEKEQEGSLVSLRAQLSNLTAAYDRLNKEEREGSKGQGLQKKINSVTNELKGAEAETQRFYRNVGNYEAAILGAVQSNVPFIGQIMQMQNEMGGVQKAFTIGKSAVASFGKQLLALLANPIVAILSGIAVAVMAVAKAINSSEEESNRWKVITAPLSRALSFLLSIVQNLAAGILSVVEVGAKFTNWIASLAEKIPGVGKYIKEMNDANREAVALSKERIAIEEQERDNTVKNAKDALTVSKLRVKAKDKEKYSAKDRLAFVREANKLEEQQAKRNKDIAVQKLENLKTESRWSKNKKKTNEELVQLEANVYNAQKEYFDKTRRLKEQEIEVINENKSAEKSALDAKKQAAEQAKAIRDKEIAEVRKAEDEMLKLVKDKRLQQTKEVNYQYNRQVEDLKRRLKNETDLTKSAREAIRKQIVSIEQQKKDALAKLSDEQLAKEIADRQKLIETQLASVKVGSEQEYQLKMQQLITQRNAELSQKELTEQMKLAITQKYNKQIDDLSAKHDDDILKKQQDAIKTRFEMEIEQAHGNEEEVLRVKMEQKLTELNTMQQLEGESIDAFNLRKLKVQNEYNDSKQALAEKEIDIEQAKLQSMSEITGGLISLTEAIGESDKSLAMASKVLALAQIAINSGVAVAEGVKAAAGKPFPLNLAAIATTVATILSNIANAVKTVKSAKFAQGGEVTGPGTSTSDSIPAMLSNGESVLTAAATSMFSPLLSSFNMMGGGVPININTTSSSNQTIGEDMLARAVAKGMMMAPPPVVSVEEYTSVANRVKYLEELGNV